MPTGKAITQGAHAALMTYQAASDERKTAYHRDGLGTKICLGAPHLSAILRWRDWAASLGLPHYLVEDTGRNTTFGGIPTISALGIGPLYAEEARALRRLQLLP